LQVSRFVTAVLDAPLQARALLFDFLPGDLLAFGASEPVMLLLTGLLLLSLSRIGLHTSRSEPTQRRTVVIPTADVVPQPQPVASVHPAKRAA
jgi:hypothetical protein